MRKFLRWVGLALAGVLVGLYLARNVIVRRVIEARWPVTIGHLECSPFRGRLEAQGLRGHSPSAIFNAAAVTVDYRTLSILRGNPHLNAMTVLLSEVVLTKPKLGTPNATAFLGADRPYRIDSLQVRVGTVITPTKRYPLNQTIVFQNVTDLAAMWRAVFGQIDALKSP